MHIYNKKITFSPTDIVRFFESEFASYMDHFEKAVTEDIRTDLGVHRDPPDPLYSLIIDMGNEHEANLIKKMEKTDSVTRIETDKTDHDTAVYQTLTAMKKGEEKIHQAAIKKDIIFGYADLLIKKQGSSFLGDHYYIPYDFKISKYPKPSAIIQLCCYCDILQSIQKRLPSVFAMITKDESSHFFNTASFFHFYQFLKKQFLNYHSAFSKDHIPIPDKMAEHRDWSIFARKRLHKLDDISLVAGIRSTHGVLLKRKGIKTLSELSRYKTNPKPVKGIPGTTFRILKDQAAIQLASRGKVRPEFKLLPHTGKRQGLEMLPPANEGDVFFDMEGYPLLGTEGLEYLYGNAINEQPHYMCFWATSEKEEEAAFKEWLDWVYRRWEQNPGMHIYHYGHYEPSTIKKLMGKYGTGERQVDTLLRNQVLVNLHRIVIQGLRIGVFSYSLKEVEQLYYEKRKTDMKSGGHCAVQFFHFLNTNDTMENSPFLKKIKSYNQDDCFSTRDLCQFLWNIQKNNNIRYISFSHKTAEEREYNRDNIRGECKAIAQKLLSQVPASKRNLHLSQMETEESLYVTRLLANLLEFHIREDKPGWWEYFSHLDMSEEEMLEAKNTVAFCRWVESYNEQYKIQFEREQEVGFHEKDSVIILENTNNIRDTYTILQLNLMEGFLWLKPNRQNNIPKNKIFTLIPEKNDYYKINIFRALLRTAHNFSPHAPHFGLKKCVYDLLLRKTPNLPDHKGPLISDKNEIVKEIASHIANLNHSVFCIQGPPGTGKTHTAAHAILGLIKKGKRVGITANSHKAILNILKIIFEQNDNKICFQCQKVKDSKHPIEEKRFLKNFPVELTSGKNINRSATITGGTTFFFSRPEQMEEYDYLFVDEASQVSLANIVAAAGATKNIVLVGDQNQLDQPIQASHPGESGYSALTYYTDGKSIIHEDKGVFLPVSYRMHPQICRFISNQFYNEKLTYHPTTVHQKILIPNRQIQLKKKHRSSDNSLLQHQPVVNFPSKDKTHSPSLTTGLPESGICFIPVKHSGNTHFSIEEAKVISHLYKELLKKAYINRTGEKKAMTTKDILIVAPYNVQVAFLKKELGTDEARVASVDRFQGQEAPVCILSLTASTIQDAPRGIPFLLNKNRLNVALSRAQCLSIVVGSNNLADTHISSIPNMELMNIWCQITSLYNVPPEKFTLT